MKTALVTGGAGFLGTHLVEKLVAENYFVIVVDNFSTANPENEAFINNFSEKVKLIKADVVDDWSPWLGLIDPPYLRSVKYVFHFASPASPKMFDSKSIEILKVNSVGLENALKFADSQKARLIFASTSEVYGDAQVSPQGESYWGHVHSFGPRSCYDESKRFGEALIFSWNQKYKTEHGPVRIFNTYGPRMHPNDGRVIINLLVQALNKEALTVYGDGRQTRSFCYVDDLIEGVMKYAEANLAVPVNIGNPNEISILKLAEIVQGIFGSKDLQIILEDLPKHDPQRRCPDISYALQVLNPWKPKIGLKEGLKKTLQWLEDTKDQPHNK